MAPHSSALACKIPWMGQPGGPAVHGVAKSRTRLSDFTFTFHFHHSGPQSPFVLEAVEHPGLHMALVCVYVCVPTCVSVCLAETMRSSKAPSLGSIPTLPEAGPEQVP